LVTKAPAIHYFFSGKTIVRAYHEILEERGEDAAWYSRHDPELDGWERGNTINGLTHMQFRKLVQAGNWIVLERSRKPIGRIGRHIAKRWFFRTMSLAISPFALIPGLEEFLLHRVTYILERPSE
jgi:hypothetical protein